MPGAPSTHAAQQPAIPTRLQRQLEEAWGVRQANFDSEIAFARPSGTLPVSLTGSDCELDCAHCGGHYLRHMVGLSTALSRAPQDRQSYLVSGGCVASTGQVPFMEHLDELSALRRRGRLNFHVGLVGDREAQALAGLADVVSFDLVGDDRTIREVLNLDRSVADYERTLHALQHHVKVVPHILVGLAGGQIRGEMTAVRIAARAGCDALVFIVLIPTPGTDFADKTPPHPHAVAELLAASRQLMPRAALGLGCMRPAGAYRRVLDPLAVRAGLQSVVMPAPEAVVAARELGLKAVYTTECCVL